MRRWCGGWEERMRGVERQRDGCIWDKRNMAKERVVWGRGGENERYRKTERRVYMGIRETRRKRG